MPGDPLERRNKIANRRDGGGHPFDRAMCVRDGPFERVEQDDGFLELALRAVARRCRLGGKALKGSCGFGDAYGAGAGSCHVIAAGANGLPLVIVCGYDRSERCRVLDDGPTRERDDLTEPDELAGQRRGQKQYRFGSSVVAVERYGQIARIGGVHEPTL